MGVVHVHILYSYVVPSNRVVRTPENMPLHILKAIQMSNDRSFSKSKL